MEWFVGVFIGECFKEHYITRVEHFASHKTVIDVVVGKANCWSVEKSLIVVC